MGLEDWGQDTPTRQYTFGGPYLPGVGVVGGGGGGCGGGKEGGGGIS